MAEARHQHHHRPPRRQGGGQRDGLRPGDDRIFQPMDRQRAGGQRDARRIQRGQPVPRRGGQGGQPRGHLLRIAFPDQCQRGAPRRGHGAGEVVQRRGRIGQQPPPGRAQQQPIRAIRHRGRDRQQEGAGGIGRGRVAPPAGLPRRAMGAGRREDRQRFEPMEAPKRQHQFRPAALARQQRRRGGEGDAGQRHAPPGGGFRHRRAAHRGDIGGIERQPSRARQVRHAHREAGSRQAVREGVQSGVVAPAFGEARRQHQPRARHAGAGQPEIGIGQAVPPRRRGDAAEFGAVRATLDRIQHHAGLAADQARAAGQGQQA